MSEPEASEPRTLSDEIAKLRGEVAQLCAAVRALVTLVSVLDQKIDTALKGGIGADCGVVG
jgi:hypothetical protein